MSSSAFNHEHAFLSPDFSSLSLSSYVDFLPAQCVTADSDLKMSHGTCLTNENTVLLSCAGESGVDGCCGLMTSVLHTSYRLP